MNPYLKKTKRIVLITIWYWSAIWISCAIAYLSFDITQYAGWIRVGSAWTYVFIVIPALQNLFEEK
jgi:hypothetical protein